MCVYIHVLYSHCVSVYLHVEARVQCWCPQLLAILVLAAGFLNGLGAHWLSWVR